jgi:O-acetylserine/cysteine efflux transporter
MPLIGFVCILIVAIGWSFGNISSKQRRNTATANSKSRATAQVKKPSSALS